MHIFDQVKVTATGQVIDVSEFGRCCDHTHVSGHEINADGTRGGYINAKVPDGGWTLVKREVAV